MSVKTQVQDNPNATAGGATGAIVVLIVWILTLLGLDVPPTVAAALTVLISSVVVYIGPLKRRG